MKKTALILITVFVMAGCNSNSEKAKEDKALTSADKQESSGNQSNQITFKVDGNEVKTSGWNIARFAWQADPSIIWLTITSNMHKEKRTISVNLNGSVPGTYTFTENGPVSKESHGDFRPDYNKILEAYTFISGSFNITEVDTVKNVVNGSFSGVVENAKGEKLNITDGKIINGTLKKRIDEL